MTDYSKYEKIILMTKMLTTGKFFWPPAYLIRYSKRAKQISMRILPDEGLEVVLPYGRTEREAMNFIEANRDWVESHAEDLDPENLEYGVYRYALPKKIQLRCVKQTYSVSYRQKSLTKVRLKQTKPRKLVFEGRIKDFRSCEKAFHAWLGKQAEVHLIPMVERWSRRTKLEYHKVYIRHQKARWGSCSEIGDLYLNMEILFLPRELARYLILHELCHTKVFSHSKRFWALVEKFDPNYERKKTRLRDIA
jgi:predicted metal-dependent hydrolase